MYTLLIADDEPYTRKGIIKKIGQLLPGEFEILEAKDGREGLAIAAYTPVDIVLSDVRMPRMDGIEMCRQIRSLYPDCVILFLSGYSDKEYLRSAISIQAMEYIDKPVEDSMLREALNQAINSCRQLLSSRQFLAEAGKSRLARFLLSRPGRSGQLPIYLAESHLTFEAFRDSRTVIIRLLASLDVSREKLSFHENLVCCKELTTDILIRRRIPFLVTDYRENNLVIHLLSSPTRMISSLTHEYLNGLMQDISLHLTDYPHFISVGVLVTAPEEIYHSYNTAAISLQSCFYLGENSISFADISAGGSFCLTPQSFEAFRHAVHLQDRSQCETILSDLESGLRSHPGTLTSNTRENYYRLLSWLIGYVKNKSDSASLDTEQYLWELIHSANTLDELCSFTANYLTLAMEALQSPDRNSTSALIKQTIAQHYQNPALDIAFLSGRLNLSVSYLSFLFKQETGETINHFINEYRIWKAKEMLVNTNLRIADIAQETGFSNQNYFAKIFRKVTGTSPSEYRETGFT